MKTRNVQPELLPVQHRSLQKHRLRKPKRGEQREVNPERVYAAAWKEKNRPKYYHGWPLLAWIASREADRPEVISQRDAEVAASVVQWFGTAVGRGFIYDCERRILDGEERGTIEREQASLQRQIDAYREAVYARAAPRREEIQRQLKTAMKAIDAEYESFRRIELPDE